MTAEMCYFEDFLTDNGMCVFTSYLARVAFCSDWEAEDGSLGEAHRCCRQQCSRLSVLHGFDTEEIRDWLSLCFFCVFFLTNIRSQCRSQSSRHTSETWKFIKNLKLFVSLISPLPASVPVCFEDGNGCFGWSSGSFRAAAQKVWSSQSPSKLFYPSSLSFTRSRLPTRV